MENLRVAFFGTHTFAVTILQGLVDAPAIDVGLVITQPDKPTGRKKILTPPPVKVLAGSLAIPVLQPQSLKSVEIETSSFDVAVSAQYGLLIPKSLLESFKHGVLNVHTSLLPKYRGASPIQSALVNGETKTGVTIMKLDVGMDTGPVILQKSIDIRPDETYRELDERLAVLGASTLLEALPQYIEDDLVPLPQDESGATLCGQLSRDDGRIDWNSTNQDIYNQYRGLTPWPGIWTMWNEKRLKLLSISLAERNIAPGKVQIENGTLYVGCASGSIAVSKLQLEGKGPADASIFCNGHKDIQDAVLT